MSEHRGGAMEHSQKDAVSELERALDAVPEGTDLTVEQHLQVAQVHALLAVSQALSDLNKRARKHEKHRSRKGRGDRAVDRDDVIVAAGKAGLPALPRP